MSPRWDEAHTFKVWLPEISMLEIIVYDKDKRSRDDKLAYCYLPMEYIREGYRNVPLYNKDGASLHPANLFFNVEIDRNWVHTDSSWKKKLIISDFEKNFKLKYSVNFIFLILLPISTFQQFIRALNKILKNSWLKKLQNFSESFQQGKVKKYPFKKIRSISFFFCFTFLP